MSGRCIIDFFQAGLARTAQHTMGFRPGRFDGCRAAPLIVPVIPIVPAEAEASEMQGVHARSKYLSANRLGDLGSCGLSPFVSVGGLERLGDANCFVYSHPRLMLGWGLNWMVRPGTRLQKGAPVLAAYWNTTLMRSFKGQPAKGWSLARLVRPFENSLFVGVCVSLIAERSRPQVVGEAGRQLLPRFQRRP